MILDTCETGREMHLLSSPRSRENLVRNPAHDRNVEYAKPNVYTDVAYNDGAELERLRGVPPVPLTPPVVPVDSSAVMMIPGSSVILSASGAMGFRGSNGLLPLR